MYLLQGLPQSINLVFNDPLELLDLSSSCLKIKFQGGFVGSVMTISLDTSDNSSAFKQSFYPDDINDMQSFSLSNTSDGKKLTNVKKLSIKFEKSSDFFGRIIIYHLEFVA